MSSLEALSQFHLLRPWWLCSIIPALLAILLLWRQTFQAKHWQQLVAPELLPYLLDGKTTRAHSGYLLALLGAWLIAAIALAGPSWEKRPVAMEKNQQAMVIMLDLSPSMMSEDIKPSRLVRARLKIADILRQRSDGFTALLVFAGDAHVVTPLTDDIKTINNLLPDLSPAIMPLPGSNTEAAVTRAIALLQDAGITSGDLLLVTDGVTDEAQRTIIEELNTQPDYRLSILGVGTENPTPIPGSKGGFVRDKQGKIITTKLNISELQSLADKTRGLYRTITNTSADVNYLTGNKLAMPEETQKVEREFDSWYDRGHWLILLLLPIILYCFRRGVLLMLCVIPFWGLTPEKSYALSWDDLWKNKDQQGHAALLQEKHDQAAELFNSSEWKGSAFYRAGNYAEAAKEFAKDSSAQGHYNRGNALAKAGQIDEAIKAYEQALAQEPSLEDAKRNRDLLEELKKQQQDQQQDNKEQNQDQDNKDQQEKEKQDQQNSDQQSSADDSQQDQQQEQQNNQQQKQQGQNSSASEQESADQQAAQESSANSDQQANQDSMNGQSSSSGQAVETSSAANSSASNQAIAEEQTSSASEQQQQLAQEIPDDGMTDEERQAMEQWLRRVPDEPGMLLKNKFRDQYQKRRMEMYNGEWEAPENGADERW